MPVDSVPAIKPNLKPTPGLILQAVGFFFIFLGAILAGVAESKTALFGAGAGAGGFHIDWMVSACVLVALFQIGGTVTGLQYLTWFSAAWHTYTNSIWFAFADDAARRGNDGFNNGDHKMFAAGATFLLLGQWCQLLSLLPFLKAASLPDAAKRVLPKPGGIAAFVTYFLAFLTCAMMWGFADARQKQQNGGPAPSSEVLYANYLMVGGFWYGAAIFGQHVPSAIITAVGSAMLWLPTIGNADAYKGPFKKDLYKAAYVFFWLTITAAFVTLALFGPDAAAGGSESPVSPKPAAAKKPAADKKSDTTKSPPPDLEKGEPKSG